MARVLVVDDDAHMLRVLSMWLSRNGHEVLEASDGRMAMERLRNETVEMVVSDINMPQMSGVELAHWLRSEQGNSTPMILLSSRCDQLRIAEDLRPLGIAIHPKPFSPSRLMAQIEAALAGGGSSSDPGLAVARTNPKNESTNATCAAPSATGGERATTGQEENASDDATVDAVETPIEVASRSDVLGTR